MPNLPTSELRKGVHRLYIKAYYGLMSLYYSRVVNCFCAMGEMGVAVYNKAGWDIKKLYPYMYCSGDEGCSATMNCQSDKIKFVYIGRFNGGSKGVDCLIDAIKKLPKGLNICIDFVGGYGDLLQEVLNLAENNDYVRFIGKWEPATVVNHLSEYDVCLVPSKYDGWNLSANHSINAGIGCIITPEAVSEELIRYAGSGMVIDSNSTEALKAAILYVVDHPEVIMQWKQAAIAYQPRISAKMVGDYLIDIFDYTMLNRGTERPRAPWIGEKR